ncbi:hypothetical protein Tco_0014328 [Tanacetum coccineum]
MVQTKLEYFSEDYDEEREMEPRPRPTRETTPPFRPRSLGVRRQRERVVGFEEAPNREGSRAGRNAKHIRPLEIEVRENGNRGMNLPPLLAAHLGRNESGQPLQSFLTSIYGGHQPLTNIGGNLPPNEKVARSFEQPPRMFKSRRSRDMSKYYHFHKDHRHDTNDCHQLRCQIEEAIKLGQLSHLLKGIKKERAKSSENQVEGKKDKGATPTEEPILMIRQTKSYTRDNV